MAIQCRCLRVDLACDLYPAQSIKNCERERRAMGGTQLIHFTRPDQKTPKQFKKQRITDRVPFSVLDLVRSWNTGQRLVDSITR